MVTRTEFQAIKANLAKISQDRNRSEKLATLLENVTELAKLSPYVPQGDFVMRQEMNGLVKEVYSAHRASLIRNGETEEYSRYKANAALGKKDGHPFCQSHVYAEINSRLRSSPELRELASGLGGLTKQQLKGELPS
jgi:hypothetical protein